jgi:hypothetical protein
VAGWASAVRSLGAAPFYTTSWDNIASQAVARRLNLSLVGVDFYLRWVPLPPLPETADELRAIAKTLGASEADLLLGERASGAASDAA